MKRLSVISLTLLSLFAALLVGCGGSHDARVTAELDCADSLLRTSDTAAHSAALRQMLALDTARALQSDEALHARHALLLVHARYKCYVTEPADSALIGSALSYYADHHGSSADHERYTRALIYSGAVAEELGHPQQAMQHYLEAESTADPNDHFNLGYTNLRIAHIYHSNHLNDSIIIRKYTNAYNHFSVSNSPHFQLICLTELGTIFSTQNIDSAIHYISRALNLAQDDPDRFFLASNYTNLSGAYFYIDKFVEAKDCALKALNCGYEPTATEIPKCMMLLSRSYAGLGMIDSAQYYANRVANVRTLADSVHYFSMKADLAKLQGDSARFIQFSDSSNNGVIDILSKSIDDNLISIEEAFHKQNLSSELKSKNLQKWILIISVLCLLAIFGYFIYNYKQNKKKWQSLVTELYENRNELEDNHTDLLAATKKHEALRTLLMQHFKLMDELIKLGDSNPNSKLSQQLKDQIRATYSDKNFVTEMRNFVSMHADETLTDFLASCDKNLNETENNIVTLTACGFSSPEIALLTNQKDASYIRVVRHRISKKLNLDTPLEQYLSAHFKL